MNYKYYIIQSSNGAVSIVSEWDDLTKAIVAFHDKCKVLWNAPDVIEGIVQIVYSADLAVVGGYSEKISHPQVEVETDEPNE
jgi:hypothetical protein